MVRPVHFRRNPYYLMLELSLIGGTVYFCSYPLVAALSRIDVRKQEMVQRLWDYENRRAFITTGRPSPRYLRPTGFFSRARTAARGRTLPALTFRERT